MKRMMLLFSFACACLMAPLCLAADTSAIDGAWTIESVIQDGKPLDNYVGARRVHENGRYTMKAAEGKTLYTTEGTFTVDADRKTIELKPTDGRFKGHTLSGIYSHDGDTLRVAFAEPGKQRPKNFESVAGQGIVVAVMKRQP